MKQKLFYSLLLVSVMTLTAILSSGCTEEEPEMFTTQRIVINYTDSVVDASISPEAKTRSQSGSSTPAGGVLTSKSGKKLYLSCMETAWPLEKTATTRGTKVTTAGISNLGVSASVYPAASSYTSAGCGSYFYKESVSSGTPMSYYWPTTDYRISFFGYYPYNNAAFTVQSAASATGAPTYTYTVPSAIASQQDIMTGQVTDQPGGSSSPVNMILAHRCSAIHFSITNDRSEAITVNSISIEGVKYSGTLNENTWTLGSSVNSSSSNPFMLNCNTSVAAGATTDITGSSNIFLMLPQTLPSGATLKVVVDDEEFEAELTGTWVAGKEYTYTISMTEEKIDYLKFTAEEAGTFTLQIPLNTSNITSVSYSIDGGKTWVTTENSSSGVTITTPEVKAGDIVLWKGRGTRYGGSNTTYSKFSSTGKFTVSGNILTLLYEENTDNFNGFTGIPYVFYGLFRNSKVTFAGDLEIPNRMVNSSNCYSYMFQNCTALTTAPELPATSLSNYCYEGMFSGCTSLTTAPELPATTPAQYCYQYMFQNCTSLTTAPELPATTLSGFFCYKGMFSGCTSLTTAPELPATTLSGGCYYEMFSGCTSLTTAPELPAMTLTDQCYTYMFQNCTALTTAPELPATTLAQYCYQYMFRSCTALATAPELPATTLAQYCYAGMFYICTSLITAPELPATTLAQYCYQSMFRNCTSLTTAPELPATTLAQYCYSYMFDGCSNLNYIKALFTTTPGSSYTGYWVRGVSATGTFVKNSAATWNRNGYDGVPSGWTIQTYP